jgi:uncharacterized membrane protein YeaQ/YmgE (transglycosylase-associated protein family)
MVGPWNQAKLRQGQSTGPTIPYSMAAIGGLPMTGTRRAQGEGLMALESLIVLVIVGAIAGWLAGMVVKGVGFGLVGNIVVGIVGAFIGSWLLPRIGLYIGGNIIAAIINATIGAVILLIIIGLVKRA